MKHTRESLRHCCSLGDPRKFDKFDDVRLVLLIHPFLEDRSWKRTSKRNKGKERKRNKEIIGIYQKLDAMVV